MKNKTRWLWLQLLFFYAIQLLVTRFIWFSNSTLDFCLDQFSCNSIDKHLLLLDCIGRCHYGLNSFLPKLHIYQNFQDNLSSICVFSSRTFCQDICRVKLTTYRLFARSSIKLGEGTYHLVTNFLHTVKGEILGSLWLTCIRKVFKRTNVLVNQKELLVGGEFCCIFYLESLQFMCENKSGQKDLCMKTNLVYRRRIH